MAPPRVPRRDFVKTGAGLVLAFYLPPGPLGAASAARAAGDFAPNAWIKIGTDGLVTLTIDKSEMGQGAPTGLAIILAEELEADSASVRIGPGPQDPAAMPGRIAHGGRD